MADEVDLANERAALEVTARLSQINLKREFAYTGYCLNCEDDLTPDQKLESARFCSKECADDHAHLIRRQRA